MFIIEALLKQMVVFIFGSIYLYFTNVNYRLGIRCLVQSWNARKFVWRHLYIRSNCLSFLLRLAKAKSSKDGTKASSICA